MRASMLYLMTLQLFWIELVLFLGLGSTYLWLPEWTADAWGVILGFTIGWPCAWIYQEVAKNGFQKPKKRDYYK